LRQFGKKRKRPNGFWGSTENRRKVFCEFAEEMGFDPLQAENWNNVTWQQVSSKKASIQYNRRILHVLISSNI